MSVYSRFWWLSKTVLPIIMKSGQINRLTVDYKCDLKRNEFSYYTAAGMPSSDFRPMFGKVFDLRLIFDASLVFPLESTGDLADSSMRMRQINVF